MGAKTLINALGEDSSVGFVLPQSCPVKKPLTCIADDEHKELTDLEKAGASQTEETVAIQAEEQTGVKPAELELGQADSGSSVEKFSGIEVLSQEDNTEDIEKSSKSWPYCKKKANGKTIIVDTEVRRSPRVKTQKGGFKDPKCCNKNCLGCNAAPPMLSNKAIRKMGSALCDLDIELMSDDALSKKKKTAPVEKTKKKKTTPVGKKSTNEAPQDDDDNVAGTNKL
jgi:predicted extracellular nuclease